MSTSELRSVTSADGTRIGFESRGTGPALLVVHGSNLDRGGWASVADALAERYTLHLMDRRGRGLSEAGDAGYGLAREAEDIAAVVAGIGGRVFLLGHSFGATCSLEAGLISDGIAAMLLYEPPFSTPVFSPGPAIARMEELLAAGRPAAAIAALYGGAPEGESPTDEQEGTPAWAERIAAARTLVREVKAA